MYVLGNFVENKGFNSIWSIEKDVVPEEEKGRKRFETGRGRHRWEKRRQSDHRRDFGVIWPQAKEC